MHLAELGRELAVLTDSTTGDEEGLFLAQPFARPHGRERGDLGAQVLLQLVQVLRPHRLPEGVAPAPNRSV